MKYMIQYDSRKGMDCFVAIPDDENEDAFTLPGDSIAEALDYAKRTGLDVVAGCGRGEIKASEDLFDE